MRKSSECEFDEPFMKNGSTTLSEILNHADIDNASSEYQSFSSNEKVSCDKTISEISYDDLQCTKFRDDVEHDDHRYVQTKIIFSNVILQVLHLNNYIHYLCRSIYLFFLVGFCIVTIMNFQSCRSKSADRDRETCGQNHQDQYDTIVDNSMALVLVDIPATTPTTITNNEPLIVNNARVEDVLDTLRYVKERLESSMERRRMIRVVL